MWLAVWAERGRGGGVGAWMQEGERRRFKEHGRRYGGSVVRVE